MPGAADRGNVDLLDDRSLISVTGAAAGDRAGASLSAPPNSRRLVIGAPGADPNGLVDAGSAFVMTAVPTVVPADRTISLASAPGFRLDGRVAGGSAGAAVGVALDFDGNDRSEVLVGAPNVAPAAGADTAAGEAYIVPFGRSGATILGSAPDGGITIAGQPGMGLGASIAGLGDLSGDGLSDVAIGAPDASPGGRGKAGSVIVATSRRLLPSAVPATPSGIHRIDGIQAQDRLGTVVAAANLDGGGQADDLLMSAPKADALTRRNAGALYAVLGGRIDRGIFLVALGDAAVRLAGPRANERMGSSMAVGGNGELAIVGGRSSTVVVRLAAPVPAPARAADSSAQKPGCVASRDVELLVDGSASMATAVPYLRTAIDALVSKPRTTPLNVGAISIGERTRQVFPPLTVPTTGFGDTRDLRTLRLLLAGVRRRRRREDELRRRDPGRRVRAARGVGARAHHRRQPAAVRHAAAVLRQADLRHADRQRPGVPSRREPAAAREGLRRRVLPRPGSARRCRPRGRASKPASPARTS